MSSLWRVGRNSITGGQGQYGARRAVDFASYKISRYLPTDHVTHPLIELRLIELCQRRKIRNEDKLIVAKALDGVGMRWWEGQRSQRGGSKRLFRHQADIWALKEI